MSATSGAPRSADPAPTLYLLDTNIVGAAIRGREPALLQRLASMVVGEVVISSVTMGEIEYGWQRAGQPPRLRRSVDEFLMRVDVLPWDAPVSRCYGRCRAAWEAQGCSLADLDMMIAAHAMWARAILVSRDKAFVHPAGCVPVAEVGALQLEQW